LADFVDAASVFNDPEFLSTALANILPVLPEEEAYLALFHGARRVAADCDDEAPRRERAPLGSRPDPAALKRWLRRWTNVRHREAAERTLLTAIAAGSPRLNSPMPCSPPRPSARSPTLGTRSTSSTRHSSASTWSAGNTRRLCCRLSSVRWYRPVAPRNRLPGVSPLTLLRCVRKQPENSRTCLLPDAACVTGRATPHLLKSCSVTIRRGDTDEGRHILIAVARYLAAHSPTERASLQTADIARRLMRGGELHQEAGSS
jgi:hypothetical protein